jgi:hypothetical protein
VIGPGWRSDGYDVTERAYRVTALDVSHLLSFRIDASEGAPLVNLCVVVADWGDSGAGVVIDGDSIPRGSDCRTGTRDRIDGRDLILWLRIAATQPTTITLTPESPH